MKLTRRGTACNDGQVSEACEYVLQRVPYKHGAKLWVVASLNLQAAGGSDDGGVATRSKVATRVFYVCRSSSDTPPTEADWILGQDGKTPVPAFSHFVHCNLSGSSEAG